MAQIFGAHALQPHDLQGLPLPVAALIAQMQQRLEQKDREITQHRQQLQHKDREIALREAKIEKINFELARLKRWRFGAKSEALSTEQRKLFEETLQEDEASLREQLERLQREAAAAVEASGPKAKPAPRQPRRNPFPEHLRRVEHHHEPETTVCQEPNCGRAMSKRPPNPPCP